MNILLGNIISFFSALCMIFSCCSKDIKKVFIYQFGECFLLAVASCFFGTYSAVITLLLCALRNILIAYKKFTKPLMIIFLILVSISGLLVNNRGIIGLLPVIATIEYTLCCYLITDLKGTKISILINLLIWIIYSFIVLDFSTAISDSVIAIIDIFAIIKLLNKKTGI